MNITKRSLLVMLTLLLVSMSLTILQVTAQDDMDMIEPDAGTWNTWLLESGSELRLDAPPDEAATMAEIEELRELLEQQLTTICWHKSSIGMLVFRPIAGIRWQVRSILTVLFRIRLRHMV